MNLEALKKKWPGRTCNWARGGECDVAETIQALITELEEARERIRELEKEPREEAEYLGREYKGGYHA